MKNRFCKMAKSLLYAMCLISICGVSYSCSDDYNLDETSPDFLGASLYDELKSRKDRSFNTVIRLIDDLGYQPVLSATGSKTLFVADDDAWARFFASGTWKDGNGNPITSYEQLSINQKRFLFKNAMLDNAYLLEMMANVTLNSVLSKNQCLRQGTAYMATDTVPYWKYNELPVMLNEPDTTGTAATVSDLEWWNGTDFWGRRNIQSAGGMYMSVDGTSGMMTHFLEGQLKEKNIKHSDVNFILNGKEEWSESQNRSYIYDRQVVDADVVCLNGYYHVLDEVLVPPSSMAEVIRQNPSTSYFSAMLDRFSAPYYNSTLTANYRALHDIGTDSVFEKLYVADNNSRGGLTVDPDGHTLSANFPKLNYDPGWNQYSVNSTTAKEQDMAAMFVPSNDAMMYYFTKGSGVILMERFGKVPVDQINESNFLENLYQIPLDIMKSLINNLMKTSFIETVPSKWKTIMNDAQDQMFPPSQYGSEEGYRKLFDKVMLANNGAVYVMNDVISPADYASVIAPALYSTNTQIMKSLVQADDNFIEGSSAFANAPLQKYYSTYLKAMQSNFSFFVPTDEALYNHGLVDPYMFSLNRTAANIQRLRYWSFEYVKPSTSNTTGKVIPVQATARTWNPNGQRDATVDPTARGVAINRATASLTTDWGLVKRALLTEMVDQHIVVHNNNEADGVASLPNWYLSRNGAPVFIKTKGSDKYGAGMVVDGGFQLMQNSDDVADNDEDCNVTAGYDQTGVKTADDGTKEKTYGNGMTYLIDRPMQPMMYSAYHQLNANSEYSEFLKQCNGVSTELLQRAGFDLVKPDSAMAARDWEKERQKYLIFKEASNTFFTPSQEPLVRFFNNYHYTIYAPTNDAMNEAYAAGLPTWDQIDQFIIDNIDSLKIPDPNPDPSGADPERDAAVQKKYQYQQQAMAMCTSLLNFLKYHFQDHSIFVDNITADNEFQTSCVDNTTNAYIMLGTHQTNGALSVTDNLGNTHSVVSPYNVLANDMEFTKSVAQGLYSTPGCVKVNSNVVIHTLNSYLNFMSSSSWNQCGGKFSGAWATPKKAVAFVKQYRIRK